MNIFMVFGNLVEILLPENFCSVSPECDMTSMPKKFSELTIAGIAIVPPHCDLTYKVMFCIVSSHCDLSSKTIFCSVSSI